MEVCDGGWKGGGSPDRCMGAKKQISMKQDMQKATSAIAKCQPDSSLHIALLLITTEGRMRLHSSLPHVY